MPYRSNLRPSHLLAAPLLSVALGFTLAVAACHAEPPAAPPTPAAAPPTTTTAAVRPAQWAQPVPAAHLTNFYKVTDNLYRSA